MSDLARYRAIRDLEGTPEPLGADPVERALPAGAARTFVVQQHAAKGMHWDLRLEIGGVLASWAVPKGPSLDPKDKRLAIRTEDHPIEYADFEGIIPQGNYGAGAMILWDRGAYRTVDGVPPQEWLERGKLDLHLEGHKLRGRFALVRTKGEDGRSWLLLHKGEAREDIGELGPASVLSGLPVEELSEGGSRAEQVMGGLQRLRGASLEGGLSKASPHARRWCGCPVLASGLAVRAQVRRCPGHRGAQRRTRHALLALRQGRDRDLPGARARRATSSPGRLRDGRRGRIAR